MAKIGGTPKGGCNPQALTAEDAEGRALFRRWTEAAGCTVAVDRLGSMFARREGLEDLPPVVIGSHLDTQPTGGKFDGRAEVALADFAQVYAGRVLRAAAPMAALEARHSAAAKPRHWFWGEFARYRRQLAEVGAASLVANLLAVAESLFSMQVYDRVIPYQSEPTLWVLAGGALLAIVLEGALKLARSGLMDTTGKRIELAVQDRLMTRLLGMKASPGQKSPWQLFSALREFSAVREFFTATTIGSLSDLPFLG